MQFVTPLAAIIQVLLDEIALGLREQSPDKIQTILISEMLLHRYPFEMERHLFPLPGPQTLRHIIPPKDMSSTKLRHLTKNLAHQHKGRPIIRMRMAFPQVQHGLP